MRSVIAVLFLGIAAVCVYGAAAGWVATELATSLKSNTAPANSQPVIYDDIEWVNESAMQRYKAVESARRYFPWILDMPEPLALMLTALSFGGLGGSIRAGYDRIRMKQAIADYDLAVLALSMLMGLFTLGITYVVPAALTVSEPSVRPAVLLFFCTLGGAFYDHFFLWAKAQVEKLFERK